MRYIRVLTLFTISLVALTIDAQTQPDIASQNATAKHHTNGNGAEQQVIQLMNKLKEAQMRNDVATLTSIYADEYTLTEGDGTVFTKSERMAAIAKLKFASSELEDIKVHVYGNAAVMTCRATVKFLEEPLGPFSFRVTIVFANKQGRWQVVAGQESDVIK